MGKKTIGVLAACAVLLAASGCGNEIPEMTEAQNEAVTQYAAGLLLKYDTNYQSKLVDTSAAPDAKTTLSEAEQLSAQEAEPQSPEVTETETQAPESEIPTDLQPIPSLPIEQVLGLGAVTAEVTGYHICDSYPEGELSEESIFFAMNAGSGNKLLVADIQVANAGAEAVTFDTIDLDARYRILVNGEKRHNTLLTMLDDDFSAMNTTIEPGGAIRTVLIAEIPADEAEAINALQLEVSMGESKTTIDIP